MPSARIAQLESMIEGRTVNGQPAKGYAKNVEALKAELARLQAMQQTADATLAPAVESPEVIGGMAP